MKIPVYKVEDDSGQSYFTHTIDGVSAELESCTHDDDIPRVYHITLTTMDRDEYENLPEFDGF